MTEICRQGKWGKRFRLPTLPDGRGSDWDGRVSEFGMRLDWIARLAYYVPKEYTLLEQREPKSYLPLTTVEFEILLTLAAGARHGYAIMQEVAARSEGALVLRPGTLYRAIGRLLDDRLIEETSAPSGDQSTDERRRYYCTTPLGERISCLEAHRLARQVSAARTRKLLGGVRA